MKRIISLVLVLMLAFTSMFALTSCGGSDYEYIKQKGTLVVGITVYPPMDYLEDGEWTGFDAEMARLAGEELGVTVQFVIIDWNKKAAELQSKNIDLIWNGMTASAELDESMDFSVSYAENKQVVVTKKANESTYTSAGAIKNVKIAVEDGSAGHTVASDTVKGTNIVPVGDQSSALLEVKSGTSEVAIIDQTMAASLVGKGEYADLVIIDPDVVSFEREVFAVGCRTGSDMVEKLNAIFKKYYEDGTMANLAEKYGTIVLNEQALDELD